MTNLRPWDGKAENDYFADTYTMKLIDFIDYHEWL